MLVIIVKNYAIATIKALWYIPILLYFCFLAKYFVHCCFAPCFVVALGTRVLILADF